MTPLTRAILATLAYHDIFDYPLTLEEIHLYLIGQKTTPHVILESLNKMLRGDRISNKDNLYALKNRRKLFFLRKQRAKYSQAKLKRAKLFSYLLSLIPTVKLVGVTGALAMNNSRKTDDIDLMIICKKNILWTTRFFANLILFPFKRKPQLSSYRELSTVNRQLNNKACLNLFLDEKNLRIRDQNLYTAHEICQIKLLLDRNQTYSRLIKANKWVFKYLPNCLPAEALAKAGQTSFSVIPAFTLNEVEGKAGIQKSRGVKKFSTFNFQFSTVEILLKKFQLFYMRKRISTERIGDTQLFFHPQNTQERVLKDYQKLLKKLKLSR